MNYYLMARRVDENSTLLDQVSHELTEFSTGSLFPNDFEGPLIVSLDPEFENGEMATFYTDPAVIGRKEFYQGLKTLGIDNIETHGVIIKDVVKNIEIDDYVLMNILGRVSCADMDKSEYHELGEGMNVIDTLVLDATKIHSLKMFLVDEDTDCIVVDEDVYKWLKEQPFTDIYFEELTVV